MKYNKEWKRCIDLDEVDPWVAISYDKWKQRIKEGHIHFKLNWKLKLEAECTRIDERLFGMGFIDKCLVMHTKPSNAEKIKASDLNKRTLYKICKKLDKKLLKGRDAMNWYKCAISERRYMFLGSAELCRIKLALGEVQDCPVCFERVTTKNCAITRCCHIFCVDCAEKMWNLSDYFGFKSINRKMAAASQYGATCPLCRQSI